jgi:hypothetical protein
LVAHESSETQGWFSVKPLLPKAHAGLCRVGAQLPPAGGQGSRQVPEDPRRQPGLGGPDVWTVGSTWSSTGRAGRAACVFAVLSWSRVRFVRLAADGRAETTFTLLRCLRAGGRRRGDRDAPVYVRFAIHDRSGRTSATPTTRSQRGSWRRWLVSSRPTQWSRSAS